MTTFCDRIRQAIAELVADGCNEDEGLVLIEQVFGPEPLYFFAKAEERKLDEQARREEWRA